jgi:hypothetical protein
MAMQIILIFSSIVLLSGCKPLVLYGEVMDYNGKPIKGVVIVNKRSGQPDTQTRSDSTGRFFLDQMHLYDTIELTAPGDQTETEVYDYPMTKRSRITFWLMYKD